MFEIILCLLLFSALVFGFIFILFLFCALISNEFIHSSPEHLKYETIFVPGVSFSCATQSVFALNRL